MAAQSHRSNGLRGPYDGGTAGIQSTTWTDSVPPADELLAMGTRAHMTSSSTTHVGAGYSRIAILLDKLRLTLPISARLPENDDVPNLTAHAVIGSQEQLSCSTEHAP